jgi:hypothetical protein
MGLMDRYTEQHAGGRQDVRLEIVFRAILSCEQKSQLDSTPIFLSLSGATYSDSSRGLISLSNTKEDAKKPSQRNRE